MFKQIKTKFLDGKTSDEQQVQVDFHEDHLAITNISTGHTEHWVYTHIEIEEKPIDGRKGLVSYSETPLARLYLEAEDFREVAKKIPRSKSKALRLAIGIMIAMSAIIGLIFFVIPALAPVVLPHVPHSWDKKLGDYAGRYFLEPSKKCNGAEGNAALAKLADLLQNDENEFELKIIVQRSDMINAFALPGGQIVVMSPLLDNVTSQEEFIGILAHEAGHVHHRHGTERMVRYLTSTLIIDALTGGGGTAAYAAMEIHALKYGQEQEMESDTWAVNELHRLNVEPTKFADFFTNMGKAFKIDGKDSDESNFDKIFEYISTHPSGDERVANIKNLSNKLKTNSDFVPRQLLSDVEWNGIRQICN